MPRLSLDFATAQRNLSAWNPALGMALLLAGMLALGVAAWDYQNQMAETTTLQDRRDALHQRTQRLYNSTPLSTDVVAKVEQANAVYALTQTPWEGIFTALETARGKTQNGIALLSVKADTTKQELTLSGEAKDFTALSAFTSALSDIPIFKNISLTNDKLSSGNPPIVVAFDLRLVWRTSAPPH